MGAISHRRLPGLSVTICVLVVCFGVGLAPLSDTQMMVKLPGLVVGVMYVVLSAQYGIWIGSMTKQHELDAALEPIPSVCCPHARSVCPGRKRSHQQEQLAHGIGIKPDDVLRHRASHCYACSTRNLGIDN